MKKYIFIIVLVLICVIIYQGLRRGEDSKMNSNYEKIEQLEKALNKVMPSVSLHCYSSSDAWHYFDAQLVTENSNTLYDAIRAQIGTSFDSGLTTDDRLFIGVNPSTRKFRIYATDAYSEPSDEDMIYPEWNYKKLKKR